MSFFYNKADAKITNQRLLFIYLEAYVAVNKEINDLTCSSQTSVYVSLSSLSTLLLRSAEVALAKLREAVL